MMFACKLASGVQVDLNPFLGVKNDRLTQVDKQRRIFANVPRVTSPHLQEHLRAVPTKGRHAQPYHPENT